MDEDWSQFSPKQGWIEPKLFWKLADEDLIGQINFCCYYVIIVTISKSSGNVYFAASSKRSGGAILPFEPHPTLSRLCGVRDNGVVRWTWSSWKCLYLLCDWWWVGLSALLLCLRYDSFVESPFYVGYFLKSFHNQKRVWIWFGV